LQPVEVKVDPPGYGNQWCLSFRPNLKAIKDGDVFEVQVTGLKKADGTPRQMIYKTWIFK